MQLSYFADLHLIHVITQNQQLTRHLPAKKCPNHCFNSVLLNLYRDGKDAVSWHQDNEPELGKQPIIASLSFGEARKFQFKHKSRKDIARFAVTLTHGSLLVMRGKTQEYWQHQIPKTSKPIGPRINLTFRHIY